MLKCTGESEHVLGLVIGQETFKVDTVVLRHLPCELYGSFGVFKVCSSPFGLTMMSPAIIHEPLCPVIGIRCLLHVFHISIENGMIDGFHLKQSPRRLVLLLNQLRIVPTFLLVGVWRHLVGQR